MCLEYLKDKRIIALWLSGFFGANVVIRAVLLIFGVEITVPKLGIALTKEINTISLLVSLAISVVLGHWACRQLTKKQKKGKKI